MTVSKRLLDYYNRADIDTIEAGLNWYNEANELAYRLGSDLHDRDGNYFDTGITAQVISALSPAVSWGTNVKDATNMIVGYHSNNAHNVVVSTYGANKTKAIAILDGEITIQDKARKTYSFYKNILLDDNYVTIDRHAYKALHGIKKGGSEAITPKRYDSATKAYQDTAKQLGIKGYELQAIVWLQYKQEVGR
jgi:hypothetical protein